MAHDPKNPLQWVCPCLNPYCTPTENAPCNNGKGLSVLQVLRMHRKTKMEESLMNRINKEIKR